MPFLPPSSSPVTVKRGDNVQIRYPTPSTWNTNVTVNVQIGTGTDPDGITFGTKIPAVLPQSFVFNSQAGYTNAFNGTSVSGFVNVFQRNTFYYSQVIDIANIEIPIPATISAVSNGPKNSNTNNNTAQFRIYRPGATDPPWITSISANVAEGTGGLQPGDKIQLRVQVPDWYVTSTLVTFTVGDETFGTSIGQPSTQFSRTWGITTRAQDQTINQYAFTDRVDQVIYADGGDTYCYENVPITGIDGDVVLRATSTGDVQISADNSNWSQSISDQLVLNDTLYTRIINGPNYTQKRTGTLDVFATGGDTYSRGGNNYENTIGGTYGSGLYQVTQNLGTVIDNWQSWTEVDRYPDSVDAAPIFTYGVKLSVNGTPPVVAGEFVIGNSYAVSGGSGNSMIVKLTNDGFNDLIIEDPGYGYTIGDTVSITAGSCTGNVCGSQTVSLNVDEYEKVLVSADNIHDRAEPGFMYFSDVPITGLGTEYASGIYHDLEAPYTDNFDESPASAQITVATLNGQGVKMAAIIDGTGGFIRKNNSGTWGSDLIVEENDIINLKLAASPAYGITRTAKVRLQGPPDGHPTLFNPTGGPSTPTKTEKTFQLNLFTRAARTVPYPFHATPVYLSDPAVQHITEVKIDGLDLLSSAVITESSGGSGATLSIDGVNWYGHGHSVDLHPTTETLFVRQNAASVSGGLAQLTYRIGTAADVIAGDAQSDTFRVYTRQFNVLGDFVTKTWFGGGFTNYTDFQIPAYAAAEQFFVALVGAGGGYGGSDVPNSTGGPGGSGNVMRLGVNIPVTAWPLDNGGNPDFTLRIYPADRGEDGGDYVTGSGGGDGGFGYAYGGDGGNSGGGDPSGSGGGGGGASAITLSNGTLIAMIGGGGGGGGAGNDTATPLEIQYGNNGGYGSISTSTININLSGDDAPDRTGQGGGPGGGGGGYDGSAGTLINTYTENGETLQTTDLDATGGNGGGAYYNSTYVSLLDGSTLSGQGAPCGEEGAIYIEFSQQDITPDPFAFTTYDGATIQETVESNIVQITGITGTVSVSSSFSFSSSIRICDGPSDTSCGSWQASAQIGNSQYVQVKATTGNSYRSTYTVNVTVGDTTAPWDINTGPSPDSIPNPFFLTPVTGVAPSTLVESEEITISGITVPVIMTAVGSGAEISVNGGEYVTGNSGATITNGQPFTIRMLSSADFLTEVTTSVTVGNGTSTEWSVTTAAEPDSIPDPYAWIPKVGVMLETTYESNTNLIQNLGTEVDFIVEQGAGDSVLNTDLARIIKNGTLLGAGVTTTKVNNYDTIALQYTTSDVIGEIRVFNTKIGLATSTAGFYETPWNVSTAGQFGTDPEEFAFATQIALATSVLTDAVETITISGLSTNVGVGLYGTNGVQFNINDTGEWLESSLSSPANVSNGDTFKIRLLSSAIPGFTRTAFIIAGSFVTGFSVQSPASVQDPINSQWYSSITPCKYIGNTFGGQQIRFNTKFDGLPVGAIIPVFQDKLYDDSWGELDGKLDGKPDSRFPSFVYCDGGYYDPTEYPLLFSVLGYNYGEYNVGGDVYFRVPDLRNRYVKGTGVIDGNAQSSPGLNPSYTPTKQSGSSGNQEPGAFGGMWYVDTIGDPGVDELEQVVTPATGQPAQESEYFGIAQVSTTGYNEVTGLIEFITSGKATCPIGLKPEKIYDVPLHFHDLISGVPDPGKYKGRVNWGGTGGYGIDVTAPGAHLVGTNTPPTPSAGKISFNLWGYALENYTLGAEHVPGSTAPGCDDTGWYNGNRTSWTNDISPGWQGVHHAEQYGSVTIVQSGILTTSPEYDEINSYIDVDNQPFSDPTSTFGAATVRKFLSTVDIPEKLATVKSYNPVNKLKHNHWVSLTAVDNDSIYGYGNNPGGGTHSTALNTFNQLHGGASYSVNLEFSALDVGIQVLPGTFTLQQTKQLIPTPSFSPQDQVPIVTPYVWTKWMIKAF